MTDSVDYHSFPTLKVGTGWVELSVLDEPTVKVTYKGYAPVLPVRVHQTGLRYLLFISAKSLGEGIEPLRASNGGKFSGLSFKVRKAGPDTFAPYEVASV